MVYHGIPIPACENINPPLTTAFHLLYTVYIRHLPLKRSVLSPVELIIVECRLAHSHSASALKTVGPESG